MWSNPSQSKPPSSSPSQTTVQPVPPPSETASVRPAPSSVSRLGSTLKINGTISGSEDLQIDGRVQGPISLQGQKITVGSTGHLDSDISAREAVVHGRVSGNICAGDRVEIKKGSEVIGDIVTARISIEDGAHFKGRIEIDPSQPAVSADRAGLTAVGSAN